MKTVQVYLIIGTNLIIDDYTKDGGTGEVRLLCSFYHEPLHNRIKTNINKFGISNHTALKLAIQALRSYLNQTCKYELHTLSDTKFSATKDHGENYMKVRPPLVRHLQRNCLLTLQTILFNIFLVLFSISIIFCLQI